MSADNKATVIFWLYWDGYANDDDTAFEYTPNTNNANGIWIGPNSGAPASGFFQTNMHDQVASINNCVYFTRPSAAVWHRYCFTYDKSQSTAVAEHLHYVDGLSQSLTACPAQSNNLSANFDNSTLNMMSRAGTNLWGAGKEAYVQLFSRTLSSVECEQNLWYPGSLPSGLIAYLPLWGSNSPEIDLAGNSNTATVDGAAQSFDGPPTMIGGAPL